MTCACEMSLFAAILRSEFRRTVLERGIGNTGDFHQNSKTKKDDTP